MYKICIIPTIYVHAKIISDYLNASLSACDSIIACRAAVFSAMNDVCISSRPFVCSAFTHARNDMITVDVFSACAVQLFHLMPYATVRSILSKQVGEDEQGEQSGRRGRTRRAVRSVRTNKVSSQVGEDVQSIR